MKTNVDLVIPMLKKCTILKAYSYQQQSKFSIPQKFHPKPIHIFLI